MKKKIIIVLIMSIFLFCENVKAADYNNQFYFAKSSYEPFHTYIKKELNGESETYRYYPLIRRDGIKAYSLEPFKSLKENGDYEFITDGIPEKLGISKEKWREIELTMYYGYTYGNHNYLSWQAVTQILIWRFLYPKGVFEFTTTDSDDNYQKEIDELTNLVETHKNGPDFGGDEFSLKLGEILTLQDNNNTLQEYSISSSKGLRTDTYSNSLIIESLQSGEQEINMTKSYPLTTNTKTKLYYDDEGSEILSVVNDLSDYTKTIKVMVNVGNIKLDIQNENPTYYYNCSTDNKTIYGLYDGDNLLETFDASSSSSFTSKDLPAKTYQIEQISHACNDKEDKNVYDATISLEEPNANLSIKVEDSAKEIKVIKKYGGKLEENAKFIIGDSHKSFTLTTNHSGEASLKLGYGTYTLKQTSGKENYELISERTLIIDDTTNDPLILELDSNPLVGNFTLNIVRNETYYSNCSNFLETIYGLYESDTNTLIESFLGSLTKTYTLNNLPLKKYYVKQISHACNDKEDSKTYDVNLTTKNKEATLNLNVLENFVELTINKKYYNKDTDKLTLEKDAVFSISDGTNTFTLTTNSKGNAKIKLGYGTYVVTQLSGKENYALASPKTITINEDTEVDYLLEFQSDEILKNITVIVKDEDGNPIKGAVIALYKGTKKSLELTTDSEGKVTFLGLSLREYIIKELSLPEKFKKDYQSKTINLEDDSTITFTNQKVLKDELLSQEEVPKEESDIKENVPVPNTKADGDGLIIKFYTLLFTLIFYTFLSKKV